MAAGNGSDNLLNTKGAESHFTSIGVDCSHKCADDAIPQAGDTTGAGLNGAGSAKGAEGGLGFGDMARGAESAIDEIPDQIADSQEQMIGGKGSATRAWAVQKDVVDIGKAEDPFAHKGMQSVALGFADGKAYGLDKPDLIKQEANRIADEKIFGKDPEKKNH